MNTRKIVVRTGGAVVAVAVVAVVGVLVFSVIRAIGQYRSGTIASSPEALTVAQLAAKAQDQQAKRDWAGAEQTIQEAIAKDTNLDLHGQLAVVKYWLKKYDQAIAEYTLLLDAKKEPAFAQNGIGNAYRDWAQSEDALQNPSLRLERQNKAVAAYRASITADPTYVAAYSNLALLQKERGDGVAARQTVQAGLDTTKRSELKDLLDRL